jgi:hypothetical protein
MRNHGRKTCWLEAVRDAVNGEAAYGRSGFHALLAKHNWEEPAFVAVDRRRSLCRLARRESYSDVI